MKQESVGKGRFRVGYGSHQLIARQLLASAVIQEAMRRKVPHAALRCNEVRLHRRACGCRRQQACRQNPVAKSAAAHI